MDENLVNNPITQVNGNFFTDLGDALGIGTQRRAQEYNSAEATAQRQFELDLSNTAYQRAVADMKKAGLNPSLIFGSSAAASSTPGGASASIQGSSGTLMSGLTNLINAYNTSKILDMKHKIFIKK